jgi:hypothetical protein
MTDDRSDCLVCDGLGYLPCDDGSEIQCEYCDGTGKVSAAKAEITGEARPASA